MANAPAFQFYGGDWLRDPALRACSLAARGLWIDLLAYMHQSEPYGHLRLNGKPVTDAVIARLVGETEKRVCGLLAELEAAGVFSRAEDGTIYSRRMVRDGHLRKVRAEAGKKGGNPALKDKGLVKQTDNQPSKQTPTPSSSVFSLQSSNLEPPSPLPVPEDARGGGGEGRDEGVGDAPNPVARFRQRWDGSAGGYAGDDRSAPGKVAAAIAERERQRQERGE